MIPGHDAPDVHRPFPDTDALTYIQWKGTDVCMDFNCPCGFGGHVDGFFAYFVCCPKCGGVYQLGTQVLALRIDAAPTGSVVLELE